MNRREPLPAPDGFHWREEPTRMFDFHLRFYSLGLYHNNQLTEQPVVARLFTKQTHRRRTSRQVLRAFAAARLEENARVFNHTESETPE